MKNVVIVEDHPIVLSNMSFLLNRREDMQVQQTFMRGVEVRESSIFTDIDLVFLDINLPDDNGKDLCVYLKYKFPHLQIIGISAYDEWGIISEFINSGASAYVVKGSDNIELYQAIDAVNKGEQYLCAIAQQAKNAHQQNPIYSNLLLTRREKYLVASWNLELSTVENAAALNIPIGVLHAQIKGMQMKYKYPSFQTLIELLRKQKSV